jgi:hypothetical protein
MTLRRNQGRKVRTSLVEVPGIGHDWQHWIDTLPMHVANHARVLHERG